MCCLRTISILGGLGFQGDIEQLFWTQISLIFTTVLYSLIGGRNRELACTAVRCD